MLLLLLFGVALSVVGVHAMDVLWPLELKQHIHSPIFCNCIGPNNLPPAVANELTNVSLAYTTHKVCSEKPQPDFTGKVVIVDNTESSLSLFMKDEHDIVLCVQRAGGIAVWRVVGDLGEAGMCVYFSEGFENKATIPLVTSRQKLTGRIAGAVQQGKIVNVTVTMDANKWKEMFDSTAWFVYWRIIIAIANACGALFAAHAINQHLDLVGLIVPRPSVANGAAVYPVAKNGLQKHEMNRTRSFSDSISRVISWSPSKPMLGGCCLEFSAFVIRAVYCALGPLLSEPSLMYRDHVFLISITLPLDIASTLIACHLFVTWGAMGHAVRYSHIFAVAATCFAVADFLLQILLSTLQTGTFGHVHVSVAAQINIGLLVLVMLGSSGMFLRFGSQFVRRLQGHNPSSLVRSMTEDRKRKTVKAVRWMMVSAVSHLVTIAGGGFGLKTTLLFSPFGWFLGFGMVFAGVTVTGMAHTAAFTPLHHARRSHPLL